MYIMYIYTFFLIAIINNVHYSNIIQYKSTHFSFFTVFSNYAICFLSLIFFYFYNVIMAYLTQICRSDVIIKGLSKLGSMYLLNM